MSWNTILDFNKYVKLFRNIPAGDGFVEQNWGIKDPNYLVFSSESLGKSFAGKGQSWKELRYWFILSSNIQFIDPEILWPCGSSKVSLDKIYD